MAKGTKDGDGGAPAADHSPKFHTSRSDPWSWRSFIVGATVAAVLIALLLGAFLVGFHHARVVEWHWFLVHGIQHVRDLRGVNPGGPNFSHAGP